MSRNLSRFQLLSRHFTTQMSIPKTQKAIRIHEHGGPEVTKYEDIPVQEISDSEILVKNDYSGVNFIEAYSRMGLYPCKFPFTHGREGTGTVVKAGSKVSNYAVGDRVGYLKNGAFVQYMPLNSEEDKIFKVPQKLDNKIASAGLLQGLTAYVLATKVHKIQKGEAVLIHAAAGGTGAILVQLAKHFGASPVIGTTSTPEKVEIAKEAGCDHVINYKKESIPDRVKEITGGKGVSVVYDSVGKTTWSDSLESAGRLGHIVSFGNASGAAEPFRVLELSPKSLTVTRPVLHNYVHTQEEWQEATSNFFSLLANGTIKVRISKIYPLEKFADAITELESGTTTGRLLMEFP